MRRWQRWLVGQVMDSVGDTALAALSFVVGFGILAYMIWNDWELANVIRFNLSLIHIVTYLPVVGTKIENGLVLLGFDKTLAFTELWALVALILRVLGLCFHLAKMALAKAWNKQSRRRSCDACAK